MKHLKTYKAKAYKEYLGFSHPETKTIAVNVQRIWEKTGTEEKFIREFAKTLLHEHLHILARECVDKRKRWSEYGEEICIRKFCHEGFPRKDKSEYSKKKD